MIAPPSYSGYRLPPMLVAHALWLYFRVALSYRDVEELLAVRGVIVTYETVRQWCRQFGPAYANALRRLRPLSRPLRLSGGATRRADTGGGGRRAPGTPARCPHLQHVQGIVQPRQGCAAGDPGAAGPG